MKILALLDGRPGNDNQTIAIAEQLGKYETMQVSFKGLAKLPNLLLGKSMAGVSIISTPDSITATPDIVISTGRKLARVAAHIKRDTGCMAIQLMNPQMRFDNFDLVFLPEHDGIRPSKGVYTTFGAPNRIDSKLLAQHYGKFPDGINVALIGDIDVSDVEELAKIPNLYITTSRRTKPETIAALNALNPLYIHVWEPSTQNPYYSLLDAAKNIIVSGDSVGMISEACTTGKKVFLFGKTKKAKFHNFITRILEKGYAKTMRDFGSDWEPNKLSTRDNVVKIIKNYIES